MSDDLTRQFSDVVSFTEGFLDRHGQEGPQAVGWSHSADTRYQVMLEVIRPATERVTLLDFGCGTSGLYDYIVRNDIQGVSYSGLDISPRYLDISRARFPAVTYLDVDILGPRAAEVPAHDYAILNGVFTCKVEHSNSEMFSYMRAVLSKVFAISRVGLAFNVHTKQVDWERDDLFHLPVDQLLDFLCRELSRFVVIRHDYGLYEYTAYVYHEPGYAEQKDATKLLRSRG